MTEMEKLLKRAEELAGRPIDIVTTKDGKYIVLFMALMRGPPPKGDTMEQAVERFIQWAEAQPHMDLPEVDFGNTDEDTGLS